MKRQRGFTLLEVLIVVSMLALTVAAVVVSFSGPNAKEQAEDTASRFEVAFNMVSDYAVLNQAVMGLHIDGNSYCFVMLDENDKWHTIDDQALFRKTTLPDDYRLSLQLDELPWIEDPGFFDDELFDEPNSFDELEQDEKEPVPQVLILPSGEFTPFRVNIAYEPKFSDELPLLITLDGHNDLPLIREIAGEAE